MNQRLSVERSYSCKPHRAIKVRLPSYDDRHLAALRAYWKKNNAFPAMSRVCNVVSLSSSSSVFALVGRLSEGGYLERADGRVAPTKKLFARPLLGSVRAGLPQPADQVPPEVLMLNDYLIEEPMSSWLLRSSEMFAA